MHLQVVSTAVSAQIGLLSQATAPPLDAFCPKLSCVQLCWVWFTLSTAYLVCRLNAEAESDTKENAGKLLAHIGRSRVSPLTGLLPQHLQPMLEKAFAAQQGSQLKQVITVSGACSTSEVDWPVKRKPCLLLRSSRSCLCVCVWSCQVLP